MTYRYDLAELIYIGEQYENEDKLSRWSLEGGLALAVLRDLDASAAEIARLRARVGELEADPVRAKLIARSKLMARIRDSLVDIVTEVEDEGGRVYFGHTEHADILRDLAEEFDTWAWDEIMEDARKTPDLIGTIAALTARAESAEARVQELERRAEFMRGISPHVAAMLDEYDAPVSAVLARAAGGSDES